MVSILRVDARLLHGQVAVSWVNASGASSILVADDQIMKNEIAKMAVQMAKPAGVNLAVRSIDDGIALLKDPRTANMKIFVIVRTVQDALRVVNAVEGVNYVNIGGMTQKEGSVVSGAAVFINQEEAKVIEELISKVEKVDFRMVANETARSAESEIGRASCRERV